MSKKYGPWVIFGAFILFAFLFFLKPVETHAPTGQEVNRTTPKTLTITFTNTSISAEVVSTNEEMMKGLGGRTSLLPGTGMWFIFPSENIWGIWMKDMLFPIDVLWFDKNLRVVTIVERMLPDSYPRSYEPTENALYVLEVPAGFVENSHIKVGDRISAQ